MLSAAGFHEAANPSMVFPMIASFEQVTIDANRRLLPCARSRSQSALFAMYAVHVITPASRAAVPTTIRATPIHGENKSAFSPCHRNHPNDTGMMMEAGSKRRINAPPELSLE